MGLFRSLWLKIVCFWVGHDFAVKESRWRVATDDPDHVWTSYVRCDRCGVFWSRNV